MALMQQILLGFEHPNRDYLEPTVVPSPLILSSPFYVDNNQHGTKTSYENQDNQKRKITNHHEQRNNNMNSDPQHSQLIESSAIPVALTCKNPKYIELLREGRGAKIDTQDGMIEEIPFLEKEPPLEQILGTSKRNCKHSLLYFFPPSIRV